MKNKKITIIIIIIFFLNLGQSKANEEFNFDVTEIEVKNEGNFFKGLKRGTATTNENQTIITADEFEYDKVTNILIATGNVIIEEKIKDYLIYSNHITYYKNKDYIFSKGETTAKIQSLYDVTSSDVFLNRNTNVLKSNKKSIIIDDEFTEYKTDRFNFLIDKSILNGSNVKVSTNINFEESEREYYNFKDGIFNLKKKDFVASDTKIYVKKNIFNEAENDPRIYGASSKKTGNITKINKAIFTSCKLTDSCPPWKIEATDITHDKDKQDIIYRNPLMYVYDFPVFYFPKFTHPDPTVIRRSGFLQPQLNSSDITGSSLLVPYFHVLSETQDMTFRPTIFDSDIYMFHAEYRQANENSNLVADFGITKGYQSPGSSRNHIGHLFTKFTSNLNLDQFNDSKLDFSFEKTTKDTFLKVFDSNLIDMSPVVKPSSSKLKSEINISLDHGYYDFNTGLIAYENLNGYNSDRYQYILPYYNFSKNLFQNSLANFSFVSSGDNNLKDTNKLSTSVENDLNIRSIDFFSELGFKNNFNIYFKNTNSIGKNIDNVKSSPKIEAMNIYNIESSFPLSKLTNNSFNSITPKLSFRFNPTDMNNVSNINRNVSVSNIFDINRLGIGGFEQGKSLTLGLDYKKETLEDINKYFEVKLAGVLRDVPEKNIPISSSIGQRSSNLFGIIDYNISETISASYDFSIDNDFNTFEKNSIGLGLSLFRDLENGNDPKFYTNFSFTENNGKMGESNVWSNSTTVNFKKDNYLTFKTRRNRRTSFTEYYDLVYQYKNDCLVAGIKFRKSYYTDREVKPKEDLLLTFTFFPITQYEQRVKESAWKGDNAIQNFWRK